MVDQPKPPPSAVAAGASLILLPGGRSSAPSTFDEAEFFAGRSMRGRGAMEVVQFKIHEGYLREAEGWWKSRRIKQYESLSDLGRHALVRHLRWLPTVEGELEGSLLHELAMLDEVVGSWKFHNTFVKFIESVAEQVNFTLGLPDGRAEVERKLRFIKARIDAARAGFYKNVCVKMFVDRFGPYLSRIVLLDGGGREVEWDERGGEAGGGGDPSVGMFEYEIDEGGSDDE